MKKKCARPKVAMRAKRAQKEVHYVSFFSSTDKEFNIEFFVDFYFNISDNHHFLSSFNFSRSVKGIGLSNL
jgi:hypothetical protein